MTGRAITSEELEKYTEEYKNPKNPILKWLRNHSIYNWNAAHALSHPWIIIEETARQIKWAWQRVFRGWDDRVIWSIDAHIAENLPVWLRELKKYKLGFPGMLLQDDDEEMDENGIWKIKDDAFKKRGEEYDEILETIAVGFEIYAEDEWMIDMKGNEDKKEKFEKAFDLFRQYFGTFWY